MWVGIGVGIGRNRFATGIFNAYALRVTADGGITEAGQCVDAVTGILLNASLLLIPSGYKGGKLYAEIPTNGNGDLTWTRGSDAFRTNASGLLQRVPWNLLQNSETFSNAYWTKLNATISADTTTSPNGTTTADSIIESSTNGIQEIYRTPAPTTSGTFTYSVYVKNFSGTRFLNLSASATASSDYVSVRFSPLTESLSGVVVSGSFSNGSASYTAVGNGWYRVVLTFTTTSLPVPQIALSTDGSNGNVGGYGVQTYTGNGTSGLFIWGAQLVEGTTAQTYLPTTDRLNFPRLSYMYGSCPSALLEPQRTNLLTYSQAFNDATWAKVASIGGSITATDNYNASPDGNTNASRLLITNLNSAYVAKSFTSVNGSSYTISIWAKSNTASSYTFQLRDGYSGVVSSNLTVTPTWQRFTLTFTASGTTAELQFRTLVIGSYDLSIYGAQAELGAYPTTYIPTTGSATATRVADSFSRNNIYTNGLISASGGTWFVELRGNLSLIADNAPSGFWLGTSSTGTISNGTLYFRQGGGSQRTNVWKYESGTATQLYTTTTDTTKIAIKWNGTTADIFENGTKVVSGTAFTATNMEFLTTSGVGRPFFIQNMALFNSPLTDAQCQTLTT